MASRSSDRQAQPLGYAPPVPESDPDALLRTGLMMGAATIFRAYTGCMELWSERAPGLAQLGEAARGSGGDAGRAAAQLRDELMAVARECSELTVREMQRGLEDLDDFTRPSEAPSEQSTRPYKAKQ